jgi:signal transduction histidine kinase
MLIVNAPHNALFVLNDWRVVATRPLLTPFISSFTFAQWLVALNWLAVVVYFAVALLIAWRRADDWYALLLSAALIWIAWQGVMRGDTTTWRYPALLHDLLPGLIDFLPALMVVGFILLFFLFPDGRFVPRQLRWLAILMMLVTTAFIFGDTIGRLLPDYRPFLQQWAWPIWVAILLPSLLIALIAQVYRYRVVATPIQRQQMKWVLLGMGGILLPVLFGLGFTGNKPWTALLSIGLQFVVMMLLPITLGFSILRHRLWDIDIVLNRTLVFGGLTFLVAAVYVLAVGLLGVLLRGSDNLLISILATGLIAILFNPLRQRLQQGVNRFLYGDRDDPATVLSRLGQQLESAATPEVILPTLVETVAQALKLPYAAVIGADGDILAETGQRGGIATEVLPLTYQSAAVGQLLVVPRSRRESFNPPERKLLRDIARQAGAAVYAAQLTTRLQHSREQLVLAREEERRRLQRDLHDGLGPQLAGLSLKLDAARNLFERDPQAAEQLLLELKAQSQVAIADIRRLVYDLRPPALDQLGLVPALREYAAVHHGSDLSIAVEASTMMPSLPAAVEVAAYRIATEAITNVVRHAAAHYCTIRLHAGETLELEIYDDGRGVSADTRPGVGLSSMRERAAELGGTFSLQATPGEGTRLFIRLPMAKF